MDLNKIARNCCEFLESANLAKKARIINEVLHEESLYPSYKRKSFCVRLLENIVWYFRYGEACRYYNSYGFDIVGLRDMSEYLPYREFRIKRNNDNFATSPYRPYENRTILLRDKILFPLFFNAYMGEGTAIGNIALLREDGSLWNFREEAEADPLVFFQNSTQDLFVKKISGECGDGCYLIRQKDSIDVAFFEQLRGSAYVVQSMICQHPSIARINNSCVNTIRIVTIIGKDNHPPRSSVISCELVLIRSTTIAPRVG